MSRGLSEILSPSVQPVASYKESVNTRIFPEHASGFLRECLHILTIFQNRQPFTVLMRDDTIQTLQHLIAFDEKSASADVIVRQNGAPHGMCVQNRSSAQTFNDCHMEQ